MSKGLEALKTIGDLDYIDEYDYRDGSLKQHFNKEYETIEKELQRLESIDTSNPSGALKNLKDLKIMCGTKIVLDKFPEYEVVEQALIKAQEQEKALEILFEKEVDIFVLKIATSVEHYNKTQKLEQYHLTQEEFDTLKRWLEDGN